MARASKDFDYDIKVNKLDGTGKVRGFASVTFKEGQTQLFAVTGFKIIEGSNGLFIGMPNRKTADGEYKDIAFPVTADFREELQESILKEFNK